MAEAEAASGLTVGTTVGNYRVEQKIGEGGMGAVYLAEHPLLGRKAAVKVLLPEHSKRADVVNRFFNEAKTTASLKHPSLVEVFDFGFLPDGSGYIVMEYLDGESLASRLARVAPLSPEQASEIGRQLATGVGVAHEQGIVHRDLKPDNVFLVPDLEQPGRERVKILDFGIAKLVLPNAKGSKGATSTGMLLGTPLFMAPEQCRGSGQVDHRADIYSVGCILYMMVTGRPPFDHEGVGEILAAHLHEPVPPPRSINPTVPEQMELIIMRALAKAPEDRYQTMSALAADLQRFHMGPTGPARPGVTAGRVSAAGLPAAAALTDGDDFPLPPARPSALPRPTPVSAPPSGAGRALGLVGVMLLIAGGAGGLVWWRLRERPAPVTAADSPSAAPTPPAEAPSPSSSPPPSSTGPAPSVAGQAEAETDPQAGAPPVPGPDDPLPPADEPASPPAAAAGAEEPEAPAEAPPPKESTRPRPRGSSTAAKGRLSEGVKQYQRAMDHRLRGEEAEALLAFRAALKEDGLPREDRDEALRQVLNLAKKFGEVEVKSAVPGARVTVDGRFRGTTPLSAPLLLTAGPHTLVLTRDGYKPAKKTVIIEANRRLPLHFE